MHTPTTLLVLALVLVGVDTAAAGAVYKLASCAAPATEGTTTNVCPTRGAGASVSYALADVQAGTHFVQGKLRFEMVADAAVDCQIKEWKFGLGGASGFQAGAIIMHQKLAGITTWADGNAWASTSTKLATATLDPVPKCGSDDGMFCTVFGANKCDGKYGPLVVGVNKIQNMNEANPKFWLAEWDNSATIPSNAVTNSLSGGYQAPFYPPVKTAADGTGSISFFMTPAVGMTVKDNVGTAADTKIEIGDMAGSGLDFLFFVAGEEGVSLAGDFAGMGCTNVDATAVGASPPTGAACPRTPMPANSFKYNMRTNQKNADLFGAKFNPSHATKSTTEVCMDYEISVEVTGCAAPCTKFANEATFAGNALSWTAANGAKLRFATPTKYTVNQGTPGKKVAALTVRKSAVAGSPGAVRMSFCFLKTDFAASTAFAAGVGGLNIDPLASFSAPTETEAKASAARCTNSVMALCSVALTVFVVTLVGL